MKRSTIDIEKGRKSGSFINNQYCENEINGALELLELAQRPLDQLDSYCMTSPPATMGNHPCRTNSTRSSLFTLSKLKGSTLNNIQILVQPDPIKLEEMFEIFMEESGIEQDKKDIMRKNIPSSSKWELVKQHLSKPDIDMSLSQNSIKDQNKKKVSADKFSPEYFVSHLKKHTYGNKFDKIQLKVIKDLRVSLVTQPVKWLRQFTELNGLDHIIDLLSQIHHFTRFDQIHDKTTLHVLASSIEHELILGLRGYMNNGFGFQYTLNHPTCLSELISSIDSSDLDTSRIVMETFACICHFDDNSPTDNRQATIGHFKTMNSLFKLQSTRQTINPFQIIVDTFKRNANGKGRNRDQLLTICIVLINCLIDPLSSISQRIHYRNQMYASGLREILDQCRYINIEEFTQQLSQFESNENDDMKVWKDRFHDICKDWNDPILLWKDLIEGSIEKTSSKRTNTYYSLLSIIQLLSYVQYDGSVSSDYYSVIEQMMMDVIFQRTYSIDDALKKLAISSKDQKYESIMKQIIDMLQNTNQELEKDYLNMMEALEEKEKKKELIVPTHYVLTAMKEIAPSEKNSPVEIVPPEPIMTKEISILPTIHVDSSEEQSTLPLPPPPPLPLPTLDPMCNAPPPPPPGPKISSGPKMKMMPWEKIKATQGTIWETIESNIPGLASSDRSFISKIQSDFMMTELAAVTLRKTNDSITYLSSNSARTVDILLNKVKPLCMNDFINVVKSFDSEVLTEENVTQLIGIIPKEDHVLDKYKRATKAIVSKFEKVDLFIYELVKLPNIKSKLECYLTFMTLPERQNKLEYSLCCLDSGCKRIRESCFLKTAFPLLLLWGNKMNEGNPKGGAKGFAITSLMKMVETKGSKGEKSIISYLVDVMESNFENELKEIDDDLWHINQSMKICLESLESELDGYRSRITTIRNVLKEDNDQENGINGSFTKIMEPFLNHTMIPFVNSIHDTLQSTKELFLSTCKYFSAPEDVSLENEIKKITPSIFFGYFDAFYQIFQRTRQQKREEQERQQQLEARKNNQKLLKSKHGEKITFTSIKDNDQGILDQIRSRLNNRSSYKAGEPISRVSLSPITQAAAILKAKIGG